MATKCQIKCSNCKRWFNSPIRFADATTFFDNYIEKGNKVNCSFCGEIVDCNKDNMKFEERDDHGKVIYEEGKETFK